MALQRSGELSRSAAIELLMDTQGNERRTLGRDRVRHGRHAALRPGLDRPERGGVQGRHEPPRSRRRRLAPTTTTPFAAAAAHNPDADARIFLTDGEHTASTPYANGHAGGPPVVRASDSAPARRAGPVDAAAAPDRHATPAALYRRADDASELQAAMFDRQQRDHVPGAAEALQRRVRASSARPRRTR